MKKLRYTFFLFAFFACDSTETKQTSLLKPIETQEMVSILKDISIQSDPALNYSMNTQRAALRLKQLQSANQKDQGGIWITYCNELLNAGENQKVISEIENFMQQRNFTYTSLLKKETLSILEVLGIAYLRLGEYSNCLTNHNDESCILPLTAKGIHKDINGSTKAIEIFSLLHQQFPKDQYRWILNLAHMTLGHQPSKIPNSYYLDFPNSNKEQSDFPPFKEIAMNLGVAQNGLSGGVCFDDFNNDGLLDIFCTSYGLSDQCKLFINNGSSFEDRTVQAGLTGIVSGLNAVQADYNNDGHIDILILRGGWLQKGGHHPNSLLRNNGDGSFTDVSKSSRILSYHPTQTACWFDFNRDGFLDLFIGNESRNEDKHACELFVNQKDGTFKEQAAQHNLGQIYGYVKGVVAEDLNNDKWPELYISVLGDKNRLYKNNTGKFEDISQSSNTSMPVYSFPSWIWDVNNDGLNDIAVFSYDIRNTQEIASSFTQELLDKPIPFDKAKLYINKGNLQFEEQSQAFGIDKCTYAMGSNYGDLDNDGWLDFYIGNGSPQLNSVIPNRMFRNVNGKSFEEVTSAGRFGHIQKGHGAAFADFDQDGDQDIYMVMGGAYEGDFFTNVLFENPIQENNWINLDLEGTRTNKKGQGVKIRIELENGRNIYHTVGTGGSFGGNSLRSEIGLGKAEKIKNLEVLWTKSVAQNFSDLEVNSSYKIIEGDSIALKVKFKPLIFNKSTSEHHHHHHH